MRPLLVGLAIVASLATALFGPSDVGGIPSVAACGGQKEEDCDDDHGLEEYRESQSERDYPDDPPPTEEELWSSSIRIQHDGWAAAHLATEEAVATWWRTGGPTQDYYDAEEFNPSVEDLRRWGELREKTPNQPRENAPYLVGGTYTTDEEGGTYTVTTLLDDGTYTTQRANGTYTVYPGWSPQDFVRYECDTNYDDAESGGCVPADRDYDCGELRSWGIASIPVVGQDWMLLDDDGDGWGCEPLVAVLTPDEETSSIITDAIASDDDVVRVYDYTTTNPWTALVISTVAEFNAVSPPGAPRLVYVTASGDAECLDITNDEVWSQPGIIVCDTIRPEDFPYDPNAPKDGWGGVTSLVDHDTVRIALNHFVPDGYYLPAEVADNTVCHEMMHAYLRGVDDNYGSDVNSCVFGDLLSPGTTDVRLMTEAWPATVAEPSWRERVSDALPDVDIDMPDLTIDMPDLGIDIPGVDVGLPGDAQDRGLPAIEPTATPQPAIGTGVPPVSTRAECDPAYPEARTCIPPDPPFNQGCAITTERNFMVLPPDPQGLDHDGDGVGCEPIPT